MFCNFFGGVFFKHLERVTECCLTLGESFKNLKFLSTYSYGEPEYF